MLESAGCLVHNYVLRQIYSITLYCILSVVAIFWQKCSKKFKQFLLLQYYISCTKIWQPQWIEIHCKEASCTKHLDEWYKWSYHLQGSKAFKQITCIKCLCSFSERSIVARIISQAEKCWCPYPQQPSQIYAGNISCTPQIFIALSTVTKNLIETMSRGWVRLVFLFNWLGFNSLSLTCFVVSGAWIFRRLKKTSVTPKQLLNLQRLSFKHSKHHYYLLTWGILWKTVRFHTRHIAGRTKSAL